MRKILMILCLFLSVKATAFCTDHNPVITWDLDKGRVKYITHLPRQEFIKKSNDPNNKNVLGLTVANLTATVEGTPLITRRGPRYCVQLDGVRLKMGYKTIDVYIDKKYRPGSCEYQVIKDHENYHVRVHQEGMVFFRPDVEKALKAAIRKTQPRIVSNPAEVQAVFQQQVDEILSGIQPVIQHINKKLKEKNAKIDTPESYQATTKLCKNW